MLSANWIWRATLAWTLIGPSVILLAQLEAVLVVANAFGAFSLRPDVSRWPLIVAVAAFFLVTATQVAAWYWKRSRAARTALLGRRLHWETRQLAQVLKSWAGNAPPTLPEPEPEPHAPPGLVKYSSRGILMRRGLQASLRPYARISAYSWEGDSRRAGSLVARFALEPTWAYQLLDAMGVAAATSITRRSQLADARAVGASTALFVGVVPLVAAIEVILYVGTSAHAVDAAVLVGCGVVLTLILLALFYRATQLLADPAFLEDEQQYYPRLERLLELHRFDLYRGLGLQIPRSAHEERQMAVGGWRRGDDASYSLPGAAAPATTDDRVQDLADLLRGPRLVAYDGYISWEVAEGHVQLTFAGTPVSGAADSARIQVEGDGGESYAPFDVSADSQDVILAQVQESIQAPVDGRPARLTFGLSRRPSSGESSREAVAWFEIRQLGRFIQLLRIPLATGPERRSLDA